jgi:hypothetical protein
MTTPCISIRQPWAWLIINAGKDIENRSWKAFHRGRVLVHAAKGMTQEEWLGAMLFAKRTCNVPEYLLERARKEVPEQRGGIIGSVEIVDCVDGHRSPWFMGEYGFVLKNPQPLPFTPYKGSLGFFTVPESVVPA